MKDLSLRRVTEADAKQLLEWTNETETRKNSFSSEFVSWENHIAWVKKKLSDENCLFFVLMLRGEPVGVIRLDVNPELKGGVISYSIDRNYRGMGLGSKLLALVEEEGKKAGLQYLTGSVKPQNIASSRCFLANGYELIQETPEELVYRKNI